MLNAYPIELERQHQQQPPQEIDSNTLTTLTKVFFFNDERQGLERYIPPLISFARANPDRIDRATQRLFDLYTQLANLIPGVAQAQQAQQQQHQNQQHYQQQQHRQNLLSLPKTLSEQHDSLMARVARGENDDERTVYIGNLAYDGTYQEIRTIFTGAGRVEKLYVKQKDASDRSSELVGWGYCRYSQADDAENAILYFNGYNYRERPLKVSRFQNNGGGGRRSQYSPPRRRMNSTNMFDAPDFDYGEDATSQQRRSSDNHRFSEGY